MDGGLNILLAEAKVTEALRRADARRPSSATKGRTRARDAVVRLAGDADGPAIERISQLEGRRLPPGPALVAEHTGAVLAALSIAGGEAIADPFRPTAVAVDLLLRSRAELRGKHPSRRRGSLGRLGRLFSRRRRAAPAVPGSEYLLSR